jgi:hypothetical protein
MNYPLSPGQAWSQQMYKNYQIPLSTSSPAAVNSKENAVDKARYLRIYSNELYIPR